MPSVDKRVVQMDFQNAQFQKGVSETLGSLKSLTEEINNTTGAKLDGLTSSVDNVSSKFSGLNVIAGTALAKLTSEAMDAGLNIAKSLWDPIVEGGKKRALNIEQAKFQFKALGMDVDATMKSASNAVSGTAYSLDEAAKMASIFGTSGVSAGGEMEEALKAVAGTAAMSGAQFMEVGDIFADVYGKGKAQAEDFNRLAARGVGGKDVVAKFLGITQEEVGELAAKGQISAKQFSDAFSQAFGASAQKANETYTGSLSNMRAALARVGELFYTKKFAAQIPVNNQLAATIGAIKNALVPVSELYGRFVGYKADSMVAGLKVVENVVNALRDPFHDIITSLSNVDKAVKAVLAPIKDAIVDTFFGGDMDFKNSPIIKGIHSFTGLLVKLSEKLIISGETQEKVGKITKGILAPFKAFGTVVSDIAKVIGGGFVTGFKMISQMFTAAAKGIEPLKKNLEPVRENLSKLGDTLSKSIAPVKEFFQNLSFDISGPLANVVEFKDAIVDFFKSLGEGSDEKFANMLIKITEGVNDLASAPIAKITEWINNLINSINEWANTDLASWIKDVRTNLDQLSDSFNDWAGDKKDQLFKGASDSAKELDKGLDSVGKGLSKMGGKAKSAGKSLKDGLADGASFVTSGEGLDKFKEILQSLWDKVKEVTSGIADGFGKAKDAIADFTKNVDWEKVLANFNATAMVLGIAQIVKAIKGGGEKLGGFKKLVKDTVEKFNDALGSLGDALKKFGEDTPATKIFKIAAGIALIAGAVWLLAQLDTKKMLISLGAIAGVVVIFAGAMFLMGKALGKTDPKELNSMASSMVFMAIAIAIMAFAVKKLGDLDLPTLAKGLIGVAVSLGIMLGAIYLLSKPQMTASMMKASVGVGMMSVALLVLSLAVKAFGSMSWTSLAKGLTGVAVSLGIMLGAIYLLSKPKMTASLIKTAVGIGAMAVALLLMAGVIILMSKIPWDTFVDGLAKFGLMLLVMLVAILALAEIGPAIMAAAVAMAIMVVAIGAMALVIFALSQIPWETFLQGFVFFVLILGTMTMALLQLAEIGPAIMAAAFALILMAVAIGMMVAAVYILGSMDFNTLIQGVLTVGILLAGLVIAANAMVTAIPGAAAMIVMALAIGILAGVMWLLSGLSWGDILKGLVGIAGALAILIIAGIFAEAAAVGIGVIVLAVVALSFAALIAAFAVVVFAFGIFLLGPAAASAAGGLTLLANAAKDSAGAILPLIGLGFGLLVFGVGALVAGVGALLLGVGLIAMGVGLALIIAMGPAGSLALKDFVKSFSVGDVAKTAALGAALLPLGAGLLAVGIGALMTGVGMMMVSAGMALFSKAVDKLKTSIKNLTPEVEKMGNTTQDLILFGGGMKQLGGIVGTTATQMSKLGSSTKGFQTSVMLTTAAVKIFTQSVGSMPFVVLLAATGVTAAFKTMSSGVKSGMSLMVSVFKVQSTIFIVQIKQLASQTGINMRQVGRAIGTAAPFAVIQAMLFTRLLGSALKNGLKSSTSDAIPTARSIGYNIAAGLAGGISSGRSMVISAAITIASSALRAAKAALGIASPSKEFAALGMFVAMGLAHGISDNSSRAEEASANMGNDVLDEFARMVEDIAASMDDVVDFEPTISPVLDLSDVESNASKLGNMLSAATVPIDVSLNKANAASSGYENNRDFEDGYSGQTVNNFDYTQNNYSPKSLSETEVYRQTKNQLSSVKKGLKTNA